MTPAPALAAPPPQQQLPGAQCAFHPQTPAVISCARCGTFACIECQTLASDGLQYCATCMGRSPVFTLASPGNRFLANLVDGLIYLPGAILSIALISLMSRDDAAVGVLIGMVGIFGALGAQIYFQLKYGQTIGKRLFDIRVVMADGTPVSLGRLFFLRNLVGVGLVQAVPYVGTVLFFVDALMIFGASRRTLHDLIGGTIVIDSPREP